MALDIASARAAVLDPRSCRYRTFTWWSTTSNPIPSDGLEGVPVAVLFEGSGYHTWYAMATAQMPRLLATQSWGSHGPALATTATSLDLIDARTWLFKVPTGALVAGLQLDFEDLKSPDAPRPILELFSDVDSGREDLQVGGKRVLEACQAGGADGHDLGIAFAGDMHHLLCFGADADEELPFDRDLLQRMVSRRDRPSREQFLTASFPAELNRYLDGFAAVTPGATVLGGQLAAVEFAGCINAILALSSLAALRDVQRCAFEALQDLRNARFPDAQAMMNRIGELRTLEVDLSFGVEAHLEMRVLVPSLPVEQLHHDLVEALSLRRGARVAASLLSRVSAAITAEESRLRIEEHRKSEARAHRHALELAAERKLAARRRRALAAAVGVGGVFALPLTFLGTNDTEVQKSRSMFDLGYYWPYYSTFLLLVLVTVAVVWTVGHRFDPDEHARGSAVAAGDDA